MERVEPTYPNGLKEAREAASLTRRQLSGICRDLAKKNGDLYTEVAIPTIQKLETGFSQPRATTAHTLAKALKKQVSTLFPNGVDTKNRRNIQD